MNHERQSQVKDSSSILRSSRSPSRSSPQHVLVLVTAVPGSVLARHSLYVRLIPAVPCPTPAGHLLHVRLILAFSRPTPAGHFLHFASISTATSTRPPPAIAPPSIPFLLVIVRVNLLSLGHLSLQTSNLPIARPTILHFLAIYSPSPFARIYSFSDLPFAIEVSV